MAAVKVTPGVVESAIAHQDVGLLMKRLREKAEMCDSNGYHAYASVLLNFAYRIETAQSKALDELEAL